MPSFHPLTSSLSLHSLVSYSNPILTSTLSPRDDDMFCSPSSARGLDIEDVGGIYGNVDVLPENKRHAGAERMLRHPGSGNLHDVERSSPENDIQTQVAPTSLEMAYNFFIGLPDFQPTHFTTQGTTPSSRHHLLPLPIPTLAPPPLSPHPLQNLHQPPRHPLRLKQLLPLHIAPKRLTQPRLHRAGMQPHAHRLLPARPPQMEIERLDDLVDGRFGRAVRVPAAEGIVVADGAHARGHEG